MNFVKHLFFINWYDHMIFLFSLLIWWVALNDFRRLNQSYIPRINPTLSCVIIFIYCWIVFASIFWRIFCICIHEGHQSVLSVLFVWFWHHNISFISNLGSSLLFILFLKEMVQSRCYFFKYLVDFSSITTWAQILHFGVLLNEKFSFINSYRLFKLSISYWVGY